MIASESLKEYLDVARENNTDTSAILFDANSLIFFFSPPLLLLPLLYTLACMSTRAHTHRLVTGRGALGG